MNTIIKRETTWAFLTAAALLAAGCSGEGTPAEATTGTTVSASTGGTLSLSVTANGTQECFETLAASASASGGAGGYTFSLGGADAASFTIDATTGEVRFKQAPDYETKASYAIDISVTDSDGTTQTQSITVSVTPWSVTHNGTDYGCVVSPYTGKVWLDRNLGAARVCERFDDVACYGDYYQWGRNADGHEDSQSGTTSVLATDVNNVGHGEFIVNSSSPRDWVSAGIDDDGSIRSANWSKTDGSSVCPVGFRVPTIAELEAELIDAGSAQITNPTDAFNSFLKLPEAGLRGDSANMFLWSSSVESTRSGYIDLESDPGGYYIASRYTVRTFGGSVRCMRD